LSGRWPRLRDRDSVVIRRFWSVRGRNAVHGATLARRHPVTARCSSRRRPVSTARTC
jgi:hypothetical protein